MSDEMDPWIAAITSKRISRALKGFPLKRAKGWSVARLTQAIQSVANLGRDIVKMGPERQSDREARLELEDLARKVNSILTRFESPGYGAFYAVIARAALANQEQTGHFGYSSNDYLGEFVEPLRKISGLLSRAADDVRARPTQKPRWIEKEAQLMRVRFAVALADLFADAFGHEPRSNNWHSEYDDQPQPWPDFYRRIHGELFGVTEGLNLQEVLQAAERLRAGKAVGGGPGGYSLLFPTRIAS